MTQKFTFFYGNNSPFSNWYPQSFVHHGRKYNCSEQYMMYQKAMLFNDVDVAEMVMEQSDPRKQKFLGRQVRGFDAKIWIKECKDIMIPGLMSKFTQDEYSLKCLLDTNDTTIVEASPYDKVWGIGMSKDDKRATDPSKWLGQNFLGIVLMKVRDEIRRRI